MPLTLFDFVQQVDGVAVDDIPDSTQDSIDSELADQTDGQGGGTDLNNPGDVRTVAEISGDLGDRAGFTSIQDAIDGVNAENDPNGELNSPIDTGGVIAVESGTYDESVTVDVSDITLTSADGTGEAVVNRSSEPTSGGAGIEISASGVTIDGFQVESEAQDGISISQPVSGVTIQNNEITKVTGNDFGSNSGTRETANGIAVGLPGSVSQSDVTGIVIENNVISDVSTSDLGSSQDRTTANGIQVLTRQHNVSGMEITGNEISNLEAGTPGDSGDQRARGVVINVGDNNGTIGAADEFDILDNDISDLTGAGGFSDAAGIALFEAGGAASSSQDRVGPENFDVSNNQLSNLTNTGKDPAPAIFVGGIQSLGANHSVTGNTINSGSVVRFAEDQTGFDPATADALNASGNTFTGSDRLYYSDSSGPANLQTVINNNTFPADAGAAEATIATAEVEFNDQTVSSGATSLDVATAEFLGEDFNVVVHETSDLDGDGTIEVSNANGNNEIGNVETGGTPRKIGESTVSDPNNVDISKSVGSNDVTEINSDQTLIAMLHAADDSSDIQNLTNIRRSGGKPVFDQATITVN